MSLYLRTPLKAKSGTLKVLSVERISTVHQDEKSLQDQQHQSREYVAANFDGPVEWKSISSQGSGEVLDRAELRELEDLIESGEYDIVIVEDVGRICRRNHAVTICEMCEDSGTRLVALNDGIDTFDENWRMSAFFASFRHEKYNEDTSRRIRRSLRNRFTNGGVFQCPIFGYVKPAGAKSDADIQKDPAAEPIYDRWFTMLDQGASYSEVADWLNEEGVAVGPYSRSKRWTPKSVARTTHNPILKGVRVRNARKSRRINKSGRRISVKAPPEERLERECPHLAFIDPARWDRVIHKLKVRNANKRRGKNGFDPRAGVPKKRTRFPGQHIRCGVCGRQLNYQGSKSLNYLMCSGAAEYRCWSSLSVHGPSAASIVAGRVLKEIEKLPGFSEELIDSLRTKLGDWDGERQQRRCQLEDQIAAVNRKLENLSNAVGESGGNETLYAALQSAEAHPEKSLQYELAELDRRHEKPFEIPDTATIVELARSQLTTLVHESQEFARLMRKLIPEIYVFPYRLIDGGHPVLRAHVRFDLSALVEDLEDLHEVRRHLSSEFAVDLFQPPQRQVFRQPVWELTHSSTEKLTERQIGARLGITQPAVQYAKALQRQLDAAGRSDPYVPLREPPADYAKLRRYHHKRYVFEPLEGFPRQWPTG